jgi:hypothetical protein
MGMLLAISVADHAVLLEIEIFEFGVLGPESSFAGNGQ